MPIINKKSWEEYKTANPDSYGRCCVDVAEEVMRRLDTPKYKKFKVGTIIHDADKSIHAGGISGFMADCVVQMVIECHSRGKEVERKNY